MDSQHSTSSEPDDISDLIDLLAPIADKCIIFGSLIKVEACVLERIDKDNNDSMNKLYQILEYRLDQEPPLTWHDIVQALKSAAICKPDLASKIESQYISPPQQQQPSNAEPLSTQANSASGSGALLHVSESEGSLAHVVSSEAGNVVNPTIGYDFLQSSPQQNQFQCHPMYNAVPQSGLHQPHLPMPPSQLNSFQKPSQSASNPHAYQSSPMCNPRIPQMPYQRTKPMQLQGFQPAIGPFYSPQAMGGGGPFFQQGLNSQWPPQGLSAYRIMSLPPQGFQPVNGSLQAMDGRPSFFQQGLNSQRPPQGNSAHRIMLMQPEGFQPASGPFYSRQAMGSRGQELNSQWPPQGSSANANNSSSFSPHNLLNDVPPAKRYHTDTEPSSLIHDDPKIEALYGAFINLVKILYRSREIEKCPEVLKLPTPGKMFINLAFINRKTEGLWKSSDGSKIEYDEITEAMVRDGNVDVIKGRKCPIDLNSIAANMPDGALEKVILVEGAPNPHLLGSFVGDGREGK